MFVAVDRQPRRQLMRPSAVKKEFALEMDEVEDEGVSLPTLVTHQDLDEVLEEQPIKLPETRSDQGHTRRPLDGSTQVINMHFLPPGVAYTTGLSHNPFA